MPLFSAAIGAAVAIGGWLGSTALGTIALNAAIGVGLSLVQQALFAPDSAQQRPPAGITGTMGRGGTEPRAFMVGPFATPGTLLYAGTFGAVTPNAHLCQAICLSDVPVNALTGIYVDGERCTIDWDNPFADRGYPILEYRKDGKDNLWVKFYDGTQTAADPQMVNQFSDDPDYPWDETAVVTGCAYAVMTARLERSLFSGFPQYVFELEGARWYDVRKDSTAGGAGTHRWNDFSTWEYSENNAVIAYNVLRGVTYGGNWLYGLQTTGAAQFPYANWSAAMDVCDLQVAKLEDAGTEAQYRVGGEIRVDGEIIDPLKKLMTACEGRIAEVGGVYKIHIGAPDAPVLAFTDQDIVSTQGQDFDPFRGLADQLNGIAPRYPNPAEAYQEHAGPTRWNDARIAAVGGRELPTEVAYDFVPFKGQVQRLTAQQLAEYSRQRRHTLVLGPSAQILEPIDCVSWTSERNGYVDKLFRVEGMEDLPRGDVRVQIVEVDPADYDFDPATQYQDDPDGPIIIQRPPAQPITGWQVGPATIRDAENNARRPSIVVSFEGDAADVKEVRVQVRLAATGAIIFDGLIPYGEVGPDGSIRSHTLNGTFLPATLYEVQGEFVPYSGRDMTPSAWLPVTTPDIRLGAADLYPIDFDQLGEDVQDKIEEIDASLGQNARAVRARIGRVSDLAAQVMEMTAADYLARDELRRAISVDVGNAKARFDERVVLLVAEDQALGLRVDSLSASVSGNAASIVSESQARATADTALSEDISAVQASLGGKADAAALSSLSTTVTAQGEDIEANSEALTLVTAQVGDATAGGYLKMTGSAGPSGVLAQVDIAVRASVGGTVGQAAISLQAYDDGGTIKTRALHIADKFIVTDGTSEALPFVFQGGVGYLANIRVDWALIENAQIDWADITNVQIEWADIETATVQNLVVETSNIGFAAVTDQVTISGDAGDITQYSTWQTVDSFTINEAVGVFFNVIGSANLPSFEDAGSNQARVRRSDGVIVWSGSADTSNRNVSWNVMQIEDSIPAGQFSYELQLYKASKIGGGVGGSINASVRFLYWKR